MDKRLMLNNLIKHYSNGSESDFAKKIGVTPQTITNWKNRNTFNLDKIYTNCENINADWLISCKGEMLKPNKVVTNDSTLTPKIVTITPNNDDNIVLVPVKAQAGYLNGYGDPEFIEQLPSYSLPNMRNGIFRMFQVEGDSMYPTMHSNSYVVGQFVDNWNYIRDNRIYVLVTNEGVIVKRVLNRIEKYGDLYCKSDNRKEYPSYSLPPENIKEIWECKMLLSYEFLDPADIYDRVSDLEAEIMHLKDLCNDI